MGNNNSAGANSTPNSPATKRNDSGRPKHLGILGHRRRASHQSPLSPTKDIANNELFQSEGTGTSKAGGPDASHNSIHQAQSHTANHPVTQNTAASGERRRSETGSVSHSRAGSLRIGVGGRRNTGAQIAPITTTVKLNLNRRTIATITKLWNRARSMGTNEPGRSILHRILTESPAIGDVFAAGYPLAHGPTTMTDGDRRGSGSITNTPPTCEPTGPDNAGNGGTPIQDIANSVANSLSGLGDFSTLGGHHRLGLGHGKIDMELHSKRFTKTLDDAIKHLGSWETDVAGKLQALGAKHASMRAIGFKPAYWDVFAEAMIEETLDWGSRRERSLAIRHAWIVIVSAIIDEMKSGYRAEVRAKNLERHHQQQHLHEDKTQTKNLAKSSEPEADDMLDDEAPKRSNYFHKISIVNQRPPTLEQLRAASGNNDIPPAQTTVTHTDLANQTRHNRHRHSSIPPGVQTHDISVSGVSHLMPSGASSSRQNTNPNLPLNEDDRMTALGAQNSFSQSHDDLVGLLHLDDAEAGDDHYHMHPINSSNNQGGDGRSTRDGTTSNNLTATPSRASFRNRPSTVRYERSPVMMKREMQQNRQNQRHHQNQPQQQQQYTTYQQHQQYQQMLQKQQMFQQQQQQEQQQQLVQQQMIQQQLYQQQQQRVLQQQRANQNQQQYGRNPRVEELYQDNYFRPRTSSK